MPADPNLHVSRDNTVTFTVTLGRVTEHEVDRGLTRWFHDGSPRESQFKGFGYRSRNEAARYLAKVKNEKKGEVSGE